MSCKTKKFYSECRSIQTYQDPKQIIAMDSAYMVTVLYIYRFYKHTLINFGIKRNIALGAFFKL